MARFGHVPIKTVIAVETARSLGSAPREALLRHMLVGASTPILFAGGKARCAVQRGRVV